MIRKGWVIGLLAALGVFPVVATAHSAAVEIWTDRGSDAVYQPGERVQIKARTTDDAYLLVYDIDAEGYLHVLFPYRDQSGFVESPAEPPP